MHPPNITYDYDGDRWVTRLVFPTGAYEYGKMSPYHYELFVKKLRRNFGQAMVWIKKFPTTRVESAGTSR